MTLQTGDVMTKATMCRQCGLIELTGDVSKLRRLDGDLCRCPQPVPSADRRAEHSRRRLT